MGRLNNATPVELLHGNYNEFQKSWDIAYRFLYLIQKRCCSQLDLMFRNRNVPRYFSTDNIYNSHISNNSNWRLQWKHSNIETSIGIIWAMGNICNPCVNWMLWSYCLASSFLLVAWCIHSPHPRVQEHLLHPTFSIKQQTECVTQSKSPL